MTLVLTTAWLPAPVAADEGSREAGAATSPNASGPLERLIERALRRAGLVDESDWSGRAHQSPFWPDLQLRGTTAMSSDPARGQARDVWGVQATLTWPMGLGGAVEPQLARDDRLRALRRERLIERVSELWRARERGLHRRRSDTSDPLAAALARLRQEEMSAALEALVGAPLAVVLDDGGAR